MPSPRVDQVSERPLEELAQTVSEQAVVLARQQLEVARRGLTTKAKEAAPGAAMLGGAALLGALASGTGTAALLRLLARRPGASAAVAVTGAYAGAGAVLAREGLVRLRDVGWLAADDAVENAEPEDASDDVAQKARPEKAVRNVKQTAASTKQRGKSASQAAKRSTQRSRATGSKPRASRTQSGHTQGRASRRTT
jgi:hypothetical protein